MPTISWACSGNQLQTDRLRLTRKIPSFVVQARLRVKDLGVGYIFLFADAFYKLICITPAVTNSKGILPPSKDAHDYLSFAP